MMSLRARIVPLCVALVVGACGGTPSSDAIPNSEAAEKAEQFAAAAASTNALDRYNMVMEFTGVDAEGAGGSGRFDCDVFVATGVDCALDVTMEGESLALHIVSESESTDIFLGTSMYGDEESMFWTKVPAAMLSDSGFMMWEGPVVGPVRQLLNLEAVGHANVPYRGESFDRFTVEVPADDPLTTPVWFVFDESSTGSTTAEVYVSDLAGEGTIRYITYDLAVPEATISVSLSIEALPADVSFALPSDDALDFDNFQDGDDWFLGEPDDDWLDDTYDPAVMEELYGACADGDLAACDELYWESPYGSEEEAFARSCGGTRTSPVYGGSCTQEDADVGMLGALRRDCDLGDQIACDMLYWRSPLGSADESYGSTCGGREPAGTFGACGTYDFDELRDQCTAGDFEACDMLFFTSPVDSDDELFGATCGGRSPDPLESAGLCATDWEYWEDTGLSARQSCADGDLAACDDLYWSSPEGSDDELFGATCGGRDAGLTPGYCDRSV